MKGLRKYLTPFAPDQSGAVSVLYELGGMLVICDAGGCTGDVCGFDEARWFETRSVVFSAGLREHTLTVITQVRDILESGITPKAQYGKHCKACSLSDLCQPQLMVRDKSLAYQQRLFSTDAVDEETSE